MFNSKYSISSGCQPILSGCTMVRSAPPTHDHLHPSSTSSSLWYFILSKYLDNIDILGSSVSTEPFKGLNFLRLTQSDCSEILRMSDLGGNLPTTQSHKNFGTGQLELRGELRLKLKSPDTQIGVPLHHHSSIPKFYYSGSRRPPLTSVFLQKRSLSALVPTFSGRQDSHSPN